MAKSLRSKSKRAFRAIKRSDPKSIYHSTDALRTARLAQKLQEQSKGKKVGQEDEQEDGEPKVEGEGAMEVEGKASGEAEEDKEQSTKVSTSGHRMTGREIWKSSKRGIQVRRAPTTVTWGKRTQGRPSRRR